MKHSPAAFLALVSFTLLLSACGVRFGDAEEGNEFFQSIKVTGDMRAGQPLTVVVDYESNYPVGVELKCELRDETSLIKDIGGEMVEPIPDGGGDATPVPGASSFDFTVDAPGDYRVECLTPLDEDNYIDEEITVGEPAPAATPTEPQG